MGLHMRMDMGATYRAELSLSMLERLAANATVAAELAKLGCSDVVVTGAGAVRCADWTWALGSADVVLPGCVSNAWETG